MFSDHPELIITECKSPTPLEEVQNSEFQASSDVTNDSDLINNNESSQNTYPPENSTIEIFVKEDFEETISEIVKSVWHNVAQELSEEMDGAIIEFEMEMNKN